jgi:ABC-2 type transport system ATP-binding protein
MLEVRDITRAYGKNKVLKGISFDAAPGDQIAIIGRNGSGKSTFLRILAGIDKPAEGTITFWGHRADKEKSVFRQFTGYLPQDNPLLDELNVQDNISLWSGRGGSPSEELIREFFLDDILKKKVSQLSGGMKRRVAIACACVGNPPVLIMDEPTAALDIYYKKEIRTWMKNFRQGNGIIVVATHDELEMNDSTKVFSMENGVLTCRR